MLRRALAVGPYFRPEDLADDDITPVQVEAGLKLLEALGFVRQVKLDRWLCYRLVDPDADLAIKPDGWTA